MTDPRRQPPVQQGLFGPLEPAPKPAPSVAPAAHDDERRALAAQLPKGLAMGTSSWSFPGWRGLVYSPDAAQKHLARHGLAAYAQHPMLSAVGVDRTFYAPIARDDYARYRDAVPADFRFLVKAWGELTTPVLRGQPGRNARYLDPQVAIDEVVGPATEGLGDKLGALVFQFPPQGAVAREADAFADLLQAFFDALPTGVPYRVELRDEALFTDRYVSALQATSARHCYCVHPRMPSIARQRERAPIDAPVAVRWMLHDGFGYEQAKERYQPFDRLVDGDPTTRAEVAALCSFALAQDLPVMVIANNKAEGSAPLTIEELARAIVSAPRPAPGS